MSILILLINIISLIVLKERSTLFYESEQMSNNVAYNTFSDTNFFVWLSGMFLSRRQVFRILSLIWINAVLWALMPLFGWGRYGPEVHGLSCSLAWGELREAGGLSFIFSSFAVTLVVPGVVIVTCYACIAARLHCRYKAMGSRRRFSSRARVVRRVVLVCGLHVVLPTDPFHFRNQKYLSLI